MISIKVEGGTLTSTPACNSCSHSICMTDRHGQESVYCQQMGQNLRSIPVKCSNWTSKGEWMAGYQIRNMATLISRHKGGLLFVSPSKELRAFDSKGKEYKLSPKDVGYIPDLNG